MNLLTRVTFVHFFVLTSSTVLVSMCNVYVYLYMYAFANGNLVVVNLCSKETNPFILLFKLADKLFWHTLKSEVSVALYHRINAIMPLLNAVSLSRR